MKNKLFILALLGLSPSIQGFASSEIDPNRLWGRCEGRFVIVRDENQNEVYRTSYYKSPGRCEHDGALANGMIASARTLGKKMTIGGSDNPDKDFKVLLDESGNSVRGPDGKNEISTKGMVVRCEDSELIVEVLGHGQVYHSTRYQNPATCSRDASTVAAAIRTAQERQKYVSMSFTDQPAKDILASSNEDPSLKPDAHRGSERCQVINPDLVVFNGENYVRVSRGVINDLNRTVKRGAPNPSSMPEGGVEESGRALNAR